MRGLKYLSVSTEVQAALAEQLGSDFQREKQAAQQSRRIRYLVVPVALAVIAALLFALVHH